jgi:hypothetical protein
MRKIAFIAFIVLIALSGCERRPSPSDYMEMKKARKDFKKHRKEWIEEMHRVEQGIDWRVIDRETRRAKTALRLAKPALIAGTTETLADGHLYGRWIERGSDNLSGRMHTADVDFDRGYIYNGSSGGNIWRANLDGEGWISLNDEMQINDINMVRVIDHAGGKRLIVAGSWPASVYFTDDEGVNWHSADGLDAIRSWGWFRSCQIANDSTRSIYLLGSEWDYDLWRQRTVIYKSVDHGESFFKIYDHGLSPNLHDLWTSRFDTTDVFLLIRETLTVFGICGIDTISTIPLSGGITEVTNVNLTGCYRDDEHYFYTAYAYNAGHSDIYGSSADAESWSYRGRVEEHPFLLSGNNFTCSNINPNNLFFGAVQAYRSFDGGATWTMHNNWWDYYGNEATMLHADIPGIDAILTPSGEEFLLISTDGGLYISRDSMMSVNNLSLSGLAVSQYYSTYTCRFDPNIIYAGSQDQGFQRCQSDSGGMLDFDQLISGDYGHIVSCDGGYSIWTNYCGFTMFYPNAISSDWKVTWEFEGSNYLWLPPLMEDPTAADRVFLGGGGTDGGAHIWHLRAHALWISATELSFDFSLGEENIKVAAMAYSPIDPHFRYVLTNVGNFFYSTDGGTVWERSPAFTGPESHYFYGSSIIASPVNLGTVFIAGSGYSNPAVYRSIDHGLSFTPMDDGLPNTLIYEMAITPESELLFAATEVGPYAFIFDEDRWFDIAGHSAPDQVYWTVDYIPAISTARFGTYGRGIWDFVLDSVTAISETEENQLPIKASLRAHPNPFNSEVTISFELPRESLGELNIYDSGGRLITRLHSGIFKAGGNSFVWNAKTLSGVDVPSGNYLALLTIDDLTSNTKLVLVK